MAANKRKTFKKIITSDELSEQINPENQKLVDRFLKNFATKRSPNSVKAYRSNFNIFLTWNLLNNDNKFFIDLKKFELLDFFDYGVDELRWSPARFSQVHSSLSSFSDFIENILDEKYPNFRNIVKKIEKLPKEPVRVKSIFSQEEINGLMEWLNQQDKHQEECLLALIIGSGSRVSELNRFTLDNIDLNNMAFEDLFLETTEEIQVKGMGTNGKKILKYIIKDLFVPHYEKWLPIRKEIMEKNNQEHNSIFIKSDGTPAKVSTFRSWMDKWDDHLSKHWYPHAGRHYWCSYLSSIGVEAELIQDLQKWSSDAMVKIYNDNTAKDKKWKGLSKLKDHLSISNLEDESE